MSSGVRECACGHGLQWHHETRGCGYHGFSERDRCECRLTFDEALERVVAEARAEALREHCAEVDDRALMVAEERGLAIGRAEMVAQVEAVHCQIGPYRAAQTAIGDLDREHIDVLAVGTILSDLRRELVAKYNAAIRAALGRQAGGGE